ncbi:MAG: septal ring lytic transglycosylase RlpA family protein [Pseudomonadota bacterium]
MQQPRFAARGTRRAFAALSLMLAAALLAGCASGPSRPGRDGPGDNPPPDLAQVPDAAPRVETVRPGGPNKPYELMGRSYRPLTGDPPFREKGLASWYGRKFHGRPTASGETYNMYAMTAAHPTLPIPSYVRVRNPANGREVIVRVNDRGPFHKGRIIDLSYTAALKLGVLRGVAPVEIERITYEDIRTGAWRREADAALAGTAPPRDNAAMPEAPSVAPAAAVEAAAPAPPTPEAVVATAAPAAATETARASTPDARGFWVQLGAFRQSAGAVEFQRKVERELENVAPLLAIFNDRDVHRLQAGPYRTRADAASAAERIREVLQLVPLIVERR